MEAERHVLFTLLTNENAFNSMPDFLNLEREKIFFFEDNKKLCSMIFEMVELGEEREISGYFTTSTLFNFAKKFNLRMDFISSILSGYTVANVQNSLLHIKELQMKRQAFELFFHSINKIDNVTDIDDVISSAQNKLTNILNFWQ
jgi:replicative DNA helicase